MQPNGQLHQTWKIKYQIKISFQIYYPKINYQKNHLTIYPIKQKDINTYQLFVGEFYQMYSLYAHLHCAYLEINPSVVLNDLSGIYICAEFPPYFGHESNTEESYIDRIIG